jgi:serine phosphatase RsbU (regulator of sigma subunit)
MSDPPKTGDNTTIIRGTIAPGAPRDTERAHYLAVVAGDKPGQRVRLGNQPLVIGRTEPADWILNDGEISRTHCRVYMAMDAVIVVDLESSNGTFIEGKRIAEGTELPIGARIQIGTHVIEHEWRTRQEIEDLQALGHDTEKAGQYIQSLLPKPLTSGPVRCDWVLQPAPRLGGDAFGYRVLNDRYHLIYLIDVSGHGAAAAMHSVSVLNVLRRGALPVTNFLNPANVMETLNLMFELQHHGGLSLTVWYGVYDTQTRRLSYTSAGHHPAFLVPPRRDKAIPLETPSPVIGVKRGFKFEAAVVDVPPRTMLYLFSDGAFEFATQREDVWGLDNFVRLLVQPPIPGTPEPQRLLGEARKRAIGETLEDDFALIAFQFL